MTDVRLPDLHDAFERIMRAAKQATDAMGARLLFVGRSIARRVARDALLSGGRGRPTP